MSTIFSFTDEELIIEFSRIKNEELADALAFLNEEYEENIKKRIYEHTQQTAITHNKTLIDYIKNISIMPQSDRGQIMFYIEQQKSLKYLKLELSLRIKKLHLEHSCEISIFNNLFS